MINYRLHKKIRSFFFKSIVLSALFIVYGLFFINHAHAAVISFRTNTQNVHIGQEFSADVLFDPEGADVNAIEMTVSLPENIVFVDSNDSSSLIQMWIDHPSLEADGKTLKLSGGIIGGFSGLIDPFSPDTRKPGKITQLTLRGVGPGISILDIGSAKAYLDDGSATEVRVTSIPGTVTVDNQTISSQLPASGDTESPLTFIPILEKNSLLFGGSYTLVFNTEDTNSGIDHYEVKEGDGPWTRAQSPYELKDQGLHGPILVKAVDRAGNEKVESVAIPQTVETIPNFSLSDFVFTALLIAIAVFFLIFLRKRQSKHKKGENI